MEKTKISNQSISYFKKKFKFKTYPYLDREALKPYLNSKGIKTINDNEFENREFNWKFKLNALSIIEESKGQHREFTFKDDNLILIHYPLRYEELDLTKKVKTYLNKPDGTTNKIKSRLKVNAENTIKYHIDNMTKWNKEKQELDKKVMHIEFNLSNTLQENLKLKQEIKDVKEEYKNNEEHLKTMYEFDKNDFKKLKADIKRVQKEKEDELKHINENMIEKITSEWDFEAQKGELKDEIISLKDNLSTAKLNDIQSKKEISKLKDEIEFLKQQAKIKTGPYTSGRFANHGL